MKTTKYWMEQRSLSILRTNSSNQKLFDAFVFRSTHLPTKAQDINSFCSVFDWKFSFSIDKNKMIAHTYQFHCQRWNWCQPIHRPSVIWILPVFADTEYIFVIVFECFVISKFENVKKNPRNSTLYGKRQFVWRKGRNCVPFHFWALAVPSAFRCLLC